MERHPYSARTTESLFWFAEERKVLELMVEGLSLKEIRIKNREENLFNARTEKRGSQIFSVIYGRITAMDVDFPSFFSSMDVENQKLLVLASAMAKDTLFFEFGYEVFRDRLILGINQLESLDFRTFFYNKQLADETARKWKEPTLKKLGGVYRGMLRGAGLLENINLTKWKIQRAFPDPRLEIYLKEHGLEPIWKVIMGVR